VLGGADAGLKFGAGPFEPQAHVGGDLVVAGSGGVELGGGGHFFSQGLLDVHVNVLKLGAPSKLIRRDLAKDGVEAGMDGVSFLGGDQADVGEHGRVGLAAGDVEGGEAAVEGHGLAEAEHQVGGAGGEAAAPGGLRGFCHGVREGFEHTSGEGSGQRERAMIRVGTKKPTRRSAWAEGVRLGSDSDCGRGDGLDDGHLAAGLVELDNAILQGEEGPIAADADVFAGVQLGAALADDDVAGDDGLAAELFDAATFAVALATVAGCACTFFMGHDLGSPVGIWLKGVIRLRWSGS